ncbi:hypothetical protein [Pseudonocardia sp. GCM10023141]|uniref:hypothetical protein n=1 Tax=Pseudonocardia sp. GCM10023141 TaxID=3252653 RepID=UPI0036235C2C
MTVLSHRSALADLVRGFVVASLAVVQAVVSGMAGLGAAGTPVADVVAAYPTPLLVARWAYVIWVPIGLGFLAYAAYQLLPGQRHRMIHRRTGWWLAAAALLNTCWLLALGGHAIPLAELFLIALLIAAAVPFGRLSREPATDRVERLVFRTPVAILTGWVSITGMSATAFTGAWAGLPSNNAIAGVAAVVVLVAVAAIVAWVVLSGTAVVGYTAAAVWTLAGIAGGEPPAPVLIAVVTVIVIVLASTARRLAAAGNPPRAAWG